MNCVFHHQSDISLFNVMNQSFQDFSKIYIAVAYLTKSGLDKIGPYLISKSNVKIICGIHGSISDLYALRELVQRSSHIDCHVFIGTSIFHSKIYAFMEKDISNIIIGSPNLTLGGLERNEESFIEIKGSFNDLPIKEIVSYFNNLWEKYSLPVERYLAQHTNYKVNKNINESFSPTQNDILAEYQKIRNSKSILVFEKEVGKTILKYGRITLPKKFDRILDELKYCSLGNSRVVKIYNEYGEKFTGKFYQSSNNTTTFYQFYLNSSDLRSFSKYVDNVRRLNISLNLINHTIKTKRIP